MTTNGTASREYTFATAMAPTRELPSPASGVQLEANATHADTAELAVIRAQFPDLLTARQALAHTLAAEICVAYRNSDSTTVDVTPQITAQRKMLLLLARTMR